MLPIRPPASRLTHTLVLASTALDERIRQGQVQAAICKAGLEPANAPCVCGAPLLHRFSPASET